LGISGESPRRRAWDSKRRKRHKKREGHVQAEEWRKGRLDPGDTPTQSGWEERNIGNKRESMSKKIKNANSRERGRSCPKHGITTFVRSKKPGINGTHRWKGKRSGTFQSRSASPGTWGACAWDKAIQE